MYSHFFNRVIFFILTVSVLMILTGCQEQQTQPETHSMPPATVSVIAVSKTNVPIHIELPATLAGNKEVEIRARVSGIVESRNFEEGQIVSTGQSLFTLDLNPFTLELNKAQALLNAAKAQVEQNKRERDRFETLTNERSVSKRDFDNAASNYDISLANLESAKVALNEAKLNLEYAHVKAPVSGIIGRELVSEGSYVSGPDVLLAELTDTTNMRVRFGFSEREQLKMRQDVTNGSLTLPLHNEFDAQIILQDGSIYPHTGKVNFSDVRVNRYTGTSELQAKVVNPNSQLRPGQFVRVRLAGAVRHNVVLLPQRAVLDNGTGKFVYIATENKQNQLIALPAPVKVGEWVQQNGKNYWVIREGLTPNQRVITEGMARIFFPGMPIQVADKGE
ncbi:Toluene efflux pump periplasmic linker protein TtgA [Pseudoalteromonas holothuriae]|uniref:Toluene efflux pump periplasmic linker protein TtgA n=1 Tax=Pseudoalteromonas holothuriae TaxID=2963714 RepID=A0A9W4QZQ8_9GAMM|nr:MULTISPECIES: efflux RND transporter periplasmic adaptor subunit [unclassified Pseudoalteromonas]CAH9060621.1 Toluene efflux pump periplasmic linker protein TtgA [Pseudoalteromonas sp. CIP111951]CAH9060795.1 Toluene efflux pump periplasmic linker protein TtgA [Pseudoalteromonas sp. CIP111854]